MKLSHGAIWHILTLIILGSSLTPAASADQLTDRQYQNISEELMTSIWGGTFDNYTWWAQQCTFMPREGYPDWFWISGMEKDASQARCINKFDCPGKWKAFEWMRRATREADEYLDNDKFEDLNKSLCYTSIAGYFVAKMQDSDDLDYVRFKVVNYDWSQLNTTQSHMSWGCSGGACNNACRREISVNVRRCEQRMIARCMAGTIGEDAEKYCDLHVCEPTPECELCVACPPPQPCPACEPCVASGQVRKEVVERFVEVPVEVETVVYRNVSCPPQTAGEGDSRAWFYKLLVFLYTGLAFLLVARFAVLRMLVKPPEEGGR